MNPRNPFGSFSELILFLFSQAWGRLLCWFGFHKEEVISREYAEQLWHTGRCVRCGKEIR